MNGGPRVPSGGGSGQVGKELQRSFAGYGEIVVADRKIVDLAAPDQIRELVRRVHPQVILNAAAYTAVDRAESEPELAFAINAQAPGVLAEEAFKCDSLLIHYSTDYVFDGSQDSEWLETDKANPLNIYGASKLAGEEAIRQIGGKYLIFRTSWVDGPHGKNFLFTMLRLGRERNEISVVDDQRGAPTTSVELANATFAVVDGVLAGRFGKPEEWVGVYHMTCSGSTTWCGFAREILSGDQFAQSRNAQWWSQSRAARIPRRQSARPTLFCPMRSCARVLTSQLASWESALSQVIRVLPSN